MRRSRSTSFATRTSTRPGTRDLRRTVRFVPETGVVPGDAEWLVVGPYKEVDANRLADAGWKLELVSPRQWRIYGR